MRLVDLATALGAPLPEGADPDTGVTGVTHQADWVRPGDLFVAVRGTRFDGHDFIARAVGAGAVAAAGEGLPAGADCPVPYLTVPAARPALADAAAELAGHPSRELTVLGVTGTDGKTTTSCLLRHLLRAAGIPTGLLSTIGYELPDGVLRQPPAHFTTPEAPQVQQILREMAHAGARAVVVETSSHALALDRVRGVDYDIAVWTNLTGEHLDFHGSMEGYFADKAKLVERAREAVLNLDDAWTPRLLDRAGQVTTYRAEHRSPADADWWVTDVTEGPDDLRFTVHSPEGEAAAVLPMIGRFNVHNALAALAAGHRAGVSLEQLLTGLATFAGVPGRMEMVEREAGDPRVIVDFAHTAPSLEKALATVRVTTEGRLWVVLGSAGGPRDPSKRAPLGEVASRLADRVVFTEEDHRDTPLRDILEEMERGASRTGRGNYTSIGNRVEAIRHVIAEAAPEDTVVLAGKGPEETLERDTETIPWNELQQALDALAARRAGIRS
ncbi:UDP-N-acetylmuramoyl-L-alanyl-D-glutamate--2,6-diaminopimelate ligase [Ornithinicoccus halotolerans]|uniref:UDP-N-acetylmuramoyl-L-alanyl-D-glutamate--2, 6-diaminopimelate ligase n=1 Tax=Ornithinicoccus halotolerans TaxID=1748220 RepID=UPI001297ACE8|nr:UDP-N-acetylmuramoyl-L-alanyl-D-glutamate--2,6-diaminopimelate ligase [Ornithinicoccus halotolerans]